MEGMGLLKFSDLFTELPVPPQAAEVVGTFNVLLYIILSTTVSFLEDTILFLQVSSLYNCTIKTGNALMNTMK